MRTRQAVAVLGLGLAALLLSVGGAVGQMPYTPPSPTFSPWLNLFQRNTGPLDNYHTYVRPQFEMRDTLRQQSLTNQRQAAGLQNLTDRVGNLQKAGETSIRPTGTASVFGSYSHYYPSAGSGGARPQARRTR